MRIFGKLYSNIRDSGVMYILGKYKINNALMLYSILSANPVDVAVSILCAKFGVPPFVILLIIAFL